MRHPPWLRVLLAATLAVLGGAAFLTTFGAAHLLPAIIGAAVLVGAISLLLTGSRRWPLPLVAVAAVVALAGYLLVVVVQGFDPGALATALVDGPRRLLTSGLPADGDRSLLAVPVLLTGLATLISTEVVQRTARGAAAVLAPLVVLGLGLSAGSPFAAERLPLVGAFTVVALLLLVPGPANGAVTRAAPARRRKALVAIPVAVVLVALAVAIAPKLPGVGDRERFSLRRHVSPPVAPRVLDNPLDLIAPYVGEARPHRLLRVRLSGDPVGAPQLRLTTLDRYDGEQWSTAATFVPVGPSLEASTGQAKAGVGPKVVQAVELGRIDSAFLPALDRPTSLQTASGEVLADPTLGTLLSGSRGGPTRYEVTSSPSRRRPTASEPVATDAEATADLRLPAGVKDDIGRLAARTAPAGTPPTLAVERLRDHLATQYRLRPAGDTPSAGYSSKQVSCFLLDPACSKTGTREEFGTAFVLLARSIGIPARLVVGIKPHAVDRDGTWEADAHDLTVWAEVKYADAGWVVVDPLPATTTKAKDDNPVTNEGERDVKPKSGGGDQDQKDKSRGGAGSSDDSGGPGPAWWLLLVPAAIGALLAAPALLRAARRRKRRRVELPSAQVAGAWAEAVDRLRAGGYRGYRSAVARDVVHQAASTVPDDGTDALAQLGLQAETSTFSALATTPADADRSWQLLERFESSWRTSRSRGRRLREYFALTDLRPDA